jgi:hypothetical protein
MRYIYQGSYAAFQESKHAGEVQVEMLVPISHLVFPSAEKKVAMNIPHTRARQKIPLVIYFFLWGGSFKNTRENVKLMCLIAPTGSSRLCMLLF